MTRSFVRTYVVALAILVIVGLGFMAVSRLPELLGADPGRPRPTPAGLAPYDLDLSTSGGPKTRLTIDSEGLACASLSESPYLATACVLALNVDPAFIAAEAFGRLNVEDTPSYEAIIWRAYLDADPTICDRSGLLADRLLQCRTLAANEELVRTADELTLTLVR